MKEQLKVLTEVANDLLVSGQEADKYGHDATSAFMHDCAEKIDEAVYEIDCLQIKIPSDKQKVLQIQSTINMLDELYKTARIPNVAFYAASQLLEEYKEKMEG